MIRNTALAASAALLMALSPDVPLAAAQGGPVRALRSTPSGLPVPRFASLKAERVFVRQGPSNENAISWVYIKKDWPVEVIAEQDVWRRIRDRDGHMGWVHSRLLQGKRMVLVQGVQMQALRGKPETEARPVAWAEPGVLLQLKHCQDAWCQVETQTSIDGWLERSALWGVLPGERIE